MVFDDVVAEYLAKYPSGLLDDAGVGNDVNDALLFMLYGVF